MSPNTKTTSKGAVKQKQTLPNQKATDCLAKATEAVAALAKAKGAIKSAEDTAATSSLALGKLLYEIRDGNYYEFVVGKTYKSFPEFVKGEYNYNAPYASQLANAGGVLMTIEKASNPESPIMLPSSEGQIRPMNRLKGDDKKIVKAWINAVKAAGKDKSPTFKHVQDAMVKLSGKKHSKTDTEQKIKKYLKLVKEKLIAQFCAPNDETCKRDIARLLRSMGDELEDMGSPENDGCGS